MINDLAVGQCEMSEPPRIRRSPALEVVTDDHDPSSRHHRRNRRTQAHPALKQAARTLGVAFIGSHRASSRFIAHWIIGQFAKDAIDDLHYFKM
ncbi:MAG TPA: hypothetical protein VFP84_11295 [Kofleriaceae bacterium]|nr:hypothetical protein [Kofleriaceae bacterium]